MTIEEKLFIKTITNFIELGQQIGLDLDQIKTKFSQEIDRIKAKHRPKKKTKKKSNHKAMRPPLWISESSDND